VPVEPAPRQKSMRDLLSVASDPRWLSARWSWATRAVAVLAIGFGTVGITAAALSSEHALRPARSGSVTLTASSAVQPFAISGNPSDLLYPGAAAQPIDLKFTNPNPAAIYVTGLTVSITATTAAGCGTANFSATGFAFGTTGASSGRGGVEVPPSGSRTLSAAGVPRSDWPTVRMIETNLNQDACHGAGVTLSYTDGVAYSPAVAPSGPIPALTGLAGPGAMAAGLLLVLVGILLLTADGRRRRLASG
jgi:hypothetical protein